MEKTIEYYKAELRQETDKKEAAARMGLQLVAENTSLNERIETLTGQYLEELTVAQQEKHSLNLKLSQKCQVELSQAADLEKAMAVLDKKAAELERWKISEREFLHKFSELKKEKEELEEAHHSSRCENKKLAEHVKLLEHQVVEAQDAIANMVSNMSTEEEEQKQQSIIISLMSENQKMEKRLAELNGEIEASCAKEERLQKLYRKAIEEIEIKDDQFSSCSALLRSAKAEQEELQGELEMMKLREVDVKSRGNSLFAEVDDNRHKLLNELGTLRLQYCSLREKYDFTSKQMLKCKQQMATLLCMTAETVSSSYIRQLEQQLEQTKSELKEVTFKLKSVTASTVPQSPLLLQMNRSANSFSSEEDYNCVKLMLDQMRQKKENAEKELEDMRFLKVVEAQKLSDCQRQLFVAEHQLQTITAENAKLKLKLEEYVSNKNDSSGNVERRTKKITTRVEKIPGFESSKKEEATVSSTPLANVNSNPIENKENAGREGRPVFVKTVKSQMKPVKKVGFSPDVEKIDLSLTEERPAVGGGRKAVVPTVVLSKEATPTQCTQQ